MEPRSKGSQRAVNVGLASNVFLAVLKTGVGFVGHSAGLMADGINSITDVVYYGIVKVFMRASAKPADRQHPLGHSQMETVAALVVGCFVIATALGIFWKTSGDIYRWMAAEETGAPIGLGALSVAGATVALKLALTAATFKAGRRTRNPAVLALAWDHRNDALSAIGVTIGILFSRHGHGWVDPLAGALVAMLILHTGISILRQSSSDLMVSRPDRPLSDRLREAALLVDGVRSVEEIHSQRCGPYYVINMTVGVDGGISVAEGDRISSRVEASVHDSLDLVRHVYVHYHPSQSVGGRR